MKSPARSRRHWVMVRRILQVVQKSLLGMAPVFGVSPYLASEAAELTANRDEGRMAGETVTWEEAPPEKVVLSHSESVRWDEIVALLRQAK
jgi:hypothetical protein